MLPSIRCATLSAVAAAAALLVPAAAARAQSGPETPRRQLWNLSIYTGGTATASSDVRLRQYATNTNATFHDVNWRGKPFTGSIYYGYRIGTFFKHAPRFGMELELNHAKAYAKVEEDRRVTGTWQGQQVDETAPMDQRVQEFRITNGINTISLNLLYRVPVWTSPGFPDGRLQPYTYAGLSYYLLYAINTVNGQDNEPHGYKPSEPQWGYQLGLGIRYGITPRISFFTEAKYTEGDAKVSIDQGDGFTSLRTMHAIGGLTYGF